jgi:two-component system response regulator HydG
MQPRGSGKEILVIDSEPVILKLLDMALSEHGFTPHCASSPVEALAMCQAYQPQIVLADVDFWVEDGLQLLAGIRALRPDVRICLMTGGLPTYTADDLKRLGVAECFSKPMHLAEFVAALERQLQE